MDHLPCTSRKFQKRILIVWASAILWIYIGNIINFHQHHIWGKQLIPVAATSNRSKEKSIAKYQGHTLNAAPKCYQELTISWSHSVSLIVSPSASLKIYCAAQLPELQYLNQPRSLRAPPVL
jgi:hypothetical protein